MKEQPERKVNDEMTEPEMRSLRQWCVEQAVITGKDSVIAYANTLYNYIADGEVPLYEQKL